MASPLQEPAPAPIVALRHLDDLWFQVAGMRCNLECRHCFISCSPRNHSLEFLTLPTVLRVLEESAALGVKEYYFTGGEPFLHPQIVDLLELALNYGPTTVLTNGTLIRTDGVERLQRAADRSVFSLEFRVSLDGYTADRNDAVRGAGAFARTLEGIRCLVKHGFLPIITATQLDDGPSAGELFGGFVRLLKDVGCDRPRVKILPTLRIGAESLRNRPYLDNELLTADMMQDFDQDALLCSHSRIVTDRGVFVCPILLEAPDAWLGLTLSEAPPSFELKHRSCFTCFQYGAICANPSAGLGDG